jgi:hypothetical protein
MAGDAILIAVWAHAAEAANSATTTYHVLNWLEFIGVPFLLSELSR